MIEACHTHIALSTIRNKIDGNDARDIVQLMRLGWYKAVHAKNPEVQRLRMLLGYRKLVVRKLVDVENRICGTLRAFGLRVGSVSRGRFVARVIAHTEQADALVASWCSGIKRPQLPCPGSWP